MHLSVQGTDIIVYDTATSSGSKTYILRSTLDDHLIELAALALGDIIEEEIAEDEEDDDDMPRSNGSIISWTTCDQLGALGLLYVVLALILISGRSLSDSKSF